MSVASYREFLRAKATVATVDGFEIDPAEVNPIFDPFAGLGTVPREAVRLGRQGVGIKLSPAYFADAVHYLEAEERKHAMPTLCSALDDELAAEAA